MRAAGGTWTFCWAPIDRSAEKPGGQDESDMLKPGMRRNAGQVNFDELMTDAVLESGILKIPEIHAHVYPVF